MQDATNTSRAIWAAVAVKAFAKETGIQSETLETKVSDLLCDLMHLCHQRGIDFHKERRNAEVTFDEEMEEPLALINEALGD